MPTTRGLKLRLNRLINPSLRRLLRTHGWTSQEQLEYLMAQVHALQERATIVEVGVWYGRSALALAEACRGTHRRVFAIDPWRNYSASDNGEQSAFDGTAMMKDAGVASFEDVYQSFLRQVHELELADWITILRMTSLQAAQAWPSTRPIDLIFIDGNHTYEAVSSDLKAWSPHIAKGGSICGDDWDFPVNDDFKSVQRAVKDFLNEHPRYTLSLPRSNTWEIKIK